MSQTMKIDFVSDISCPWCVIGLKALQQALAGLGQQVAATIRFQPFELNPQMAPEGQDLFEHMAQKYGASRSQSDSTREMIRARGEELGFEFRMDKLERIYNTFDCHRLLHLARSEACQHALKLALFDAYFTRGEDPSDHEVLQKLGEQAGLDAVQVRALLASDDYADAVRRDQARWHELGIHAVPAIIINDRHLIEGGQPVAVFEQALASILAEQA